ncbi:MAG: LysR family transcriptional regulator [Myxococcaceae bacterium]|jgi:DNA-binding transcriptional LysR family regulator|nr:LysR family transcriptional regulator [Myxococcaceae bacterium]MCA3016627.1 LysR family transcriptional regulator [Myxococcaceae bacterium]
MDALQRLRLFGKVVERGSLSRAARDLGVGQPAASKALAALEADVGARLVLRSTRRLTLTEAGRRYYERSRQALAVLDEASAELADGDAPRGTLKLHGPVVLGELFLGPAAVEFQRRHPQVRCELTLLDSYVDLVAEGADLSIRLGAITDASVVRRRLGTMERLLVAAPGYLRRVGVPRRPADLAALRAVRFSGFPSGNALTLGAPGGVTTVELEPAFLSNNALTLRQALVGELGVGLVPRWLVEDDLVARRLVEVLPAFPPAPMEVSAVVPSAKFTPTRVREFLRLMTKRLARVPGMTLAPPAPT